MFYIFLYIKYSLYIFILLYFLNVKFIIISEFETDKKHLENGYAVILSFSFFLKDIIFDFCCPIIT